MNTKKLWMLALLGMIVLSFVLISGYIHREDTTEPEKRTHVIENINAKETYTLIQNNKDNPNFVILDVRTPEEFANGHIENAINLNYYSETFNNTLNKLDKNKTYLIYCRTGRRSGISLDIMNKLGFREVYNMLGGITQWQAEGLPTTK
ncbi:MAG: rhodanese-like domain-containing protein [Methanobacteriaceae archaeon]|jgi:rhodanese-related sulfurtransferase